MMAGEQGEDPILNVILVFPSLESSGSSYSWDMSHILHFHLHCHVFSKGALHHSCSVVEP